MARPKSTMQEAVDVEDYERWDRGLPELKKPVVVISSPMPPEIKDLLTPENINLEEIASVTEARLDTRKNSDGVRFIGFRVSLETNDGKKISGWMPESYYNDFRRLLFREGKVNVDNMQF